MASTKELRQRIRSIKSTAQVTKAMQLVSAAKMHKAQEAALSGKSYAKLLRTVLVAMADKISVEKHRLLQPNNNDAVATIVLSSDRGLAGALNANLYKQLETIKQTAQFITVGKKGRDYVVKTRKDLQADFKSPEKPDLLMVKTLQRMAIDAFISGSVGKVIIVYTDFINTLKQEAKIIQLLPIEKEALLQSIHAVAGDDPTEQGREYLFEPDMDSLLDDVLNHYIEMTIYQTMMESLASEHSARMIAMKSATDNANDLVSDLTLSYNQLRQNNITKELLEITTAALAMN